MDFSERLEMLIKAKNTSQKAIAEYLGIRRPTISDWKGLGTIPGADTAARLAKYLGTTVEYLITGNPPRDIPPDIMDIARKIAALTPQDREEIMALIAIKLARKPGFPETVAEPAPEYGLEPRIANDIEFVDWEMVMLPYFGKTAAGVPLDIYKEPGEYIPFPRKALKSRPEDYFVLSIQGYSMSGANIDEGDMVVIRHAEEPINGKIMLVRYEGASTLKRLAYRGGKWYLLWDDGSGREMQVDSGGFQVQGLHVWTLKPGK
jgi:SOS-response transcriptional repressor LexA